MAENLFKQGNNCLSHLSHRVCHLLSSTLLLRKFTNDTLYMKEVALPFARLDRKSPAQLPFFVHFYNDCGIVNH